MTEQKDTTKQTRKMKVYCRNSIWVQGSNAYPKKIPAGTLVELSAEDIKHFGKAVTKDIPEEFDDGTS
jgi:hypothetical protein